MQKIDAKRILGGLLTFMPLLLAFIMLAQRPHVDLLVIVGGLIVFAMAKHFGLHVPQRFVPPKAIYLGLAIGAAVVLTFYQTSGYFDTGAFGHSMPALLRSYRMWGFHPNWRTVLFSTIMMVVLITWPRKFPAFSKTVPAGFAGLLVTTGLNMLLYLDAARSPIPELFWRIPNSVLSMLLIFAVWEHIPYGKFKQMKVHEIILFAVLIGTTFWFGVLWGLALGLLTWLFFVIIKLKKQHP